MKYIKEALIFALHGITCDRHPTFFYFVPRTESLYSRTINMKCLIAFVAVLAAGSAAIIEQRAPDDVCPSGEVTYCCQLGVDGIVTDSCSTRTLQ